MTETAIETKTRGSTMHRRARMNRSPMRPTQRTTTTKDGLQTERPRPIPIRAAIMINVTGHLSMRMQNLVQQPLSLLLHHRPLPLPLSLPHRGRVLREVCKVQ